MKMIYLEPFDYISSFLPGISENVLHLRPKKVFVSVLNTSQENLAKDQIF